MTASIHQTTNNGALVAQAPIYPSACTLVDLIGYNAGSTLLYAQIHDKVDQILAGDIPLFVIPVPGLRAVFSLSVALMLTRGLQLGISSTEATFTSAGAFLAFAAQVQA